MCVTAILTETERKRQDGSVHRAEERRCRARMLRLRGPIHPQSSVPATADDAWSGKLLICRQNFAILPSSGRPLGECRLIIGSFQSAVQGGLIIIGSDSYHFALMQEVAEVD